MIIVVVVRVLRVVVVNCITYICAVAVSNRPVAHKRQGISLFLIACDVISGCSGGHVKCIAVNEKSQPPVFKVSRGTHSTVYSYLESTG